MWGVGADRLNVNARKSTACRNNNLSLGVSFKGIDGSQAVIVPGDADRSLAFGNQPIVGDQRYQVSCCIQTGKIVEAGLGIIQRTAIGKCRRIYRLDSLIGSTRISGKRYGSDGQADR